MAEVQQSTEQQKNETKTKQQQPLKYRIMKSFDLFSFLPVPKTAPVSSKRSLYGSLIMLVCFVVYFIYTFVAFVTNNTPMVNQYFDIVSADNVTLPQIAFAFFFGDPFEETINNASIFTFKYQQVIKYQSVSQPDEKITIDLIQCNPSWLPASNFSLLCPQYQANMSGSLYQTKQFVYPRIMINYCQSSETLTCVNFTQLFQYTAGGRIILYVKDEGPDFDMTTGKKVESIPYETFQFFLMPGFYPRAEIFFQAQTYTILPDFFRRYSKRIQNYLAIESSNVWLTNVSVYSVYNAYQIYFRMDQNELKSFLKYLTFMDVISLWGAFWGVLFSAFAAYFLAYNQKNFYQLNEEWENFDSRIGVKKLKNTIDWECENDNNHQDSIVFEMKQMDSSNNNNNNSQENQQL